MPASRHQARKSAEEKKSHIQLEEAACQELNSKSFQCGWQGFMGWIETKAKIQNVHRP
jgi:hypothetical protein